MKHIPLNTLEIAFAFFLIAFPFFEGQLPQFKRKVHEYVKISVTLWAVTIFVIFASIWDAFDIQAPHYLPSSDITSIICGILSVGLMAYTTYSLASLTKRPDLKEQVSRNLDKSGESFNALLPTTRNEYFVFVSLVACSAGICEELIFRWFVLHWIESHSNFVIACITSSLVFGLWHLYLGWGHVIRTAAVGLFLSLVYLYSESILLAIFLHTFMDIHAGSVAFVARTSGGQSSTEDFEKS